MLPQLQGSSHGRRCQVSDLQCQGGADAATAERESSLGRCATASRERLPRSRCQTALGCITHTFRHTFRHTLTATNDNCRQLSSPNQRLG